MITVEKIKELKKYYIDELYEKTRLEQGIDQEYINDTFFVKEVRSPHVILRSGIGYEVVNSPADQIVTSNPQAYFKGNKDITARLSSVTNQWLAMLSRENPNIFKEAVKNKLGCGESYVKVVHNEAWLLKEPRRIGLPVLLLAPNPMVIYGSPEEDDCGWEPNSGVPNRVIVFFERQPSDVIAKYPSWTNPKKEGKVEWLEYWDKDVRYFEADGESVLPEGIAPNPYKFVPFVRKYSGLGKSSADGELSSLIMSDIRMTRGLIKEDCVMRSDISSVMHLSAHKPKVLWVFEGDFDETTIKENLKFGAYDISVANVPPGTRLEDLEIAPPSPEVFQHLRDIDAKIARRHPFIMAGLPMGTSGRQDDMAYLSAKKRYKTIVENTELEFATAIEMMLKICDIYPTLKPQGLHKTDLKSTFQCNVSLEASDPIERDRQMTLGERLWNGGNGSIDLRTLHTQFQERTQEESAGIIANMLVDKLTIYNPDVAAVMGSVFAEEAGMEKWLEEARRQRASLEEGLGKVPPKTSTQRLQGEVETPLGQEMEDMSLSTKGARRPPERYLRGET